MEKPKPGLAMSNIPVKPMTNKALRSRVMVSLRKIAARM